MYAIDTLKRAHEDTLKESRKRVAMLNKSLRQNERQLNQELSRTLDNVNLGIPQPPRRRPIALRILSIFF